MDRNLTILIIEDNESEAMLLQVALTRAGIKNATRIVSSGEQAMDYLRGRASYANRNQYPFPSVLFTDLKMPGLNGFDILRWLQQHPECAIIPTIVLSNSREAKDVKVAYELGANSFMVKPQTLEQLTQMMRSAYEYWAWCEKPEMPAKCA